MTKNLIELNYVFYPSGKEPMEMEKPIRSKKTYNKKISNLIKELDKIIKKEEENKKEKNK